MWRRNWWRMTVARDLFVKWARRASASEIVATASGAGLEHMMEMRERRGMPMEGSLRRWSWKGGRGVRFGDGGGSKSRIMCLIG
jgi:hypothetical protein